VHYLIVHKVVEAARDLLKQSQEGALTSLYFYDLSERLERLLFEVRTLQPGALWFVQSTVSTVPILSGGGSDIVFSMRIGS